ncbi:MAG: hypothetical protein Tsb0021_18510 [Chlamydiales bacterium]
MYRSPPIQEKKEEFMESRHVVEIKQSRHFLIGFSLFIFFITIPTITCQYAPINPYRECMASCGENNIVEVTQDSCKCSDNNEFETCQPHERQ